MTTQPTTGQSPDSTDVLFNTVRPANMPKSPNGSTAHTAANTAGTNTATSSSATSASAVSGAARQVGQKGQSAQIAAALAALGYSFRMNDLVGDIEVDGEMLTEGVAAEIRTLMRDASFTNPKAVEDTYLAIAHQNRFHPIRDYFHGLPVWDGHPRLAELSTYIKDTHAMIEDQQGQKHTVFHLWFKRWAIGAVAKIFVGTQNPMLVLDGPQDLGKSSFVKWLASGMGSDFYSERPLNLTDKDMLVELLTQFIWEIGEFGHALRKSDVEQLKAFITMGLVTVRPAYARRAIRRPATASLIGTINSDGGGFLNDPTGSRRFLCVTLESINFDYASIDINQLWAEVLHLYHAGEPWQLAPCEKEARQALNAEHEVQDPYESLLRKYFIFTSDDDDFMSTTDMREHLESLDKLPKGNIRTTQMALATAAKRCGLRKGRRSVYGRQEHVILGITARLP